MGNASYWLIGGPLWSLVLIYAVRSAKDWPGIMQRWNERIRDRAAIEADQFTRLDARTKRLEEAEEQCRHDLADALKRIAELEGYNLGMGRSAQEAQLIISQERNRSDRENK